MTELSLLTAIPKGITAFCATNLDDILILLLFFTQVNASFRRRQIIAGQYLGFGALVLASLPGFFGGLFFPRPWIGLLGLVPIFIGVSRLLNPDDDEETSATATELNQPSRFTVLFHLKPMGWQPLPLPMGGTILVFTCRCLPVALGKV